MTVRGIVMVVAVVGCTSPKKMSDPNINWDLVIQVQGMGQVSATPGGISGDPASGLVTYPCRTQSQQTVSLQAFAATGWMFDHWEGDCAASGTNAVASVTLKEESKRDCTAPDGNTVTTCIAVFTMNGTQTTPTGAGHVSVIGSLSGDKITSMSKRSDGSLWISTESAQALGATIAPTTAVVSQVAQARTDSFESRIYSSSLSSTDTLLLAGEGTDSGGVLHPMLMALDSTNAPINAQLATSESGSMALTNTAGFQRAYNNFWVGVLDGSGAVQSGVKLTASAANPTFYGVVGTSGGVTIAFGSLSNNLFATAFNSSNTVLWAKTITTTASTGSFTAGDIVGNNVILGARTNAFTSPAQGIALFALDVTTGATSWSTVYSNTTSTLYFGNFTCTTSTCFLGGALGTQPILGTFDPSNGALGTFHAIDTANNAIANNVTIDGDDVCGSEAFGNGVYCLSQSDLTTGSCTAFPSTDVTPCTASTPTATVTDVTITATPYLPTFAPLTFMAGTGSVATTSSCP